MWLPITKDRIDKMMGWCEDILNVKEDALQFWKYIKIEPEKWSEKEMGESSGGFWVVAIFGKKVIYYNDIEEGFNLSVFTVYGAIDEYNCNQSELHDMVESLYSEIIKFRK